MKRIFPILSWLPKYSYEDFKGDLPAGVTVGILLIPQGMAYAIIAGLPPVYGLYAALVPQLVYAIFGTSKQLAIGPVALDSLIVGTGLLSLAASDSESYIQAAIFLALFVGAIQVLLGLLKFGFLINFLSKPVISGFTSAAAIIIALNQLKFIFGIDLIRTNQIHKLIGDVYAHIGVINTVAFFVGVSGILLILVIRRINRKIPAALVLMVLSIVISAIIGLDNFNVEIVGKIPIGLPKPSIPEFDTKVILELLPIAITLALVGFTEAISIAKGIEEKQEKVRVVPNQELVALGLANILGSVFKSYPTTGGFSRTAVNEQAGAKTGIAAIISSCVVAVILLFFTPVFFHLPKAILASIIIVAVLNLVDINYPVRLWKYHKDDFFMLLLTFLATLTIGIVQGIVVGIICSLLFMIYRTMKPHIAELGNIDGTDYFRNIHRFPEAIESKDILMFRFDSQLYFANAAYFRMKLRRMMHRKGEDLKLIILDAEAISHVDSTAVVMLERVISELNEKKIKLCIADATGPVRDILNRSGLMEKLGKNSLFMRNADALGYYLGKPNYIENEQYRYNDIATQNKEQRKD